MFALRQLDRPSIAPNRSEKESSLLEKDCFVALRCMKQFNRNYSIDDVQESHVSPKRAMWSILFVEVSHTLLCVNLVDVNLHNYSSCRRFASCLPLTIFKQPSEVCLYSSQFSSGLTPTNMGTRGEIEHLESAPAWRLARG